ncbi:uncharacterized protein LOC110853493 [Folsomia candida]|nr:uncharacterized protein LOC110853493 [Folsomia candida]
MVYPSPFSILENSNTSSLQYLVDSSEEDEDGFLDTSSLRGISLSGSEIGVGNSGPIIGTSATTITPPLPMPQTVTWKQPDLVGPVFMRQRHRASSVMSPSSSSSLSPPAPPLSVHNFTYPLGPGPPQPERSILATLTIDQDITKQFSSLFTTSSWETLFPVDDVSKHYRDLVLEKLRGKLSRGEYLADPRVHDVLLLIRYQPTKLMCEIIVVILLAMINSDMKMVLDAIDRLKKWLCNPQICQKDGQNTLYLHVAYIIHALEVELLTGGGKDREGKKPALAKVGFDERKNWGMALRNKMSLLIWKVEHLLRPRKDWEDEVAYPPAEEFGDVEWLLELTQLLREKRINGPFPNVVSKMEKDYINQAVRLEPRNPFVKLGLLQMISDKKKGQSASLSPEFDKSCRNLINRFSCSCVLRIQIAKFYIGRGRNRETAMEYVRYAIKCNPNHPEANLLAAKYLTGCRDDSKARLNFKTRETYYRTAMISDPTNYIATIEYFCNALGSRKAITETMALQSLFEDPSSAGGGAEGDGVALTTSLPESTATPTIPENLTRGGHVYSTGLGALIASYRNRCTGVLDDILSASYFPAWPDEAKSKIQFLQVLNFYASEEFGEALENLLHIYKKNFVTSMIHSLDDYCHKYKWDTKLNFATFKRWLIQEYDDILEMEREDKIELQQSQAEVNASEEDNDADAKNEPELSEDYEDINDNSESDDDIKEMLAYLLQIL